VLGAEVCAEFAWRPGMNVVDGILGLRKSSVRTAMLRCGNLHIELFEYHTPTPERLSPDRPVCNHGYTHFALEVRNIRSESSASSRSACDSTASRSSWGTSPPRMDATRTGMSSNGRKC